jgi:hypothetical protein
MDQDDRDELFGLPLGEFTNARNELAKRLKAEGDLNAAAEVRKLRKPSVPAWAVNQLARRRPDEVEELLLVSRHVREAQQRMVSGGGRAKLNEASRARKELLDRLAQAAADILESSGHAPSRATLDDVTNTLLATATDEEAADRVRRGVLEKELMGATGFEDAFGLTASGAAVEAARSPRAPASVGRQSVRARQRAAELAAGAEQAEAEATHLEEEARQAREAAEGARKEAERAARTADRVASGAERSRREADRLRARADRAAADVEERGN